MKELPSRKDKQETDGTKMKEKLKTLPLKMKNEDLMVQKKDSE